MLNFWIGTSIICLLITEVVALSIKAKLIREGYVKSNIKYSIFEIIRGRITSTIITFVPILNVFVVLVMLFGYDWTYNVIKKRLIEKGDYVLSK